MSDNDSVEQSKYEAQLGHEITIKRDSKPVDMEQESPDACIVQITFVKPYFDPDEERHTFIDRNTNLCRF